MYNKLFAFIKKFIPKISLIEQKVLESGSVSIEKDIIIGMPNLHSYINKYKYKKLNTTDNINKTLNYMCSIIDINNILINKKTDKTLFNKLDLNIMNNTIGKIIKKSISIGSIIFDRNSIGPIELLHKYGTFEQKEKYLNKFTIYDYIPCFGFTGFHNDSNVINIDSKGTIISKDDKLYLDITFSKKYMSLLPLANFIGLTIKLSDPNNLLKKKLPENSITILILEKNNYINKNLNIQYTNNLSDNMYFNGILYGTNIIVPIDNVIGGEYMIGKGLTMINECIEESKLIHNSKIDLLKKINHINLYTVLHTLPPVYTSSSIIIKYIPKYVAEHYNTKILNTTNIKNIRDKTAEIFENTYIMYAMQNLFNSILLENSSPSVLSTIIKKEMVEYNNININNAKNILESFDNINKNNNLEKIYKILQYPIKFKESTILPKSLFIYSKSLIKSHKYIYNIILSIDNDNIYEFKKIINNMTFDIIKIYSNIIINNIINNTKDNIIKTDNLSKQYSLLTYLCLANYKQNLIINENICGKMSDILSDLYKCYSIYWLNYHLLNSNISDKINKEQIENIEKYCINNLHNKIINNINLVLNDIKNPLKYLYLSIFTNNKYINSDEDIIFMSKLFLNNSKLSNNIIKEILIENVYLPPNIFENNTLYTRII
jgi:acyl-CoA dehydrogenase